MVSAAFSPQGPSRIAVAADGTHAAVIEAARIVVVELPAGVVVAEVGLDVESAGCDIAWVGARLLVVTRHASYTTAHLVEVTDGDGPRPLAEVRLEAPMRLAAAVGAHALVVGPAAAVLTAHEAHLTPHQVLSRSVPTAAGAAGNQFVVALPGTIEEWDPASRTPKRRLRLPRPAAITAIGGSERVVWMTTLQDPARIDVLPLVNRGQPKTHELPERIAGIYAHPRSDLIACTGAESGRLYVVDLDGRAQLRTIAADGLDRVDAAGLVIGRMIGVIAAQMNRPLAIISLDGREVVVEPRPTPIIQVRPPPRDEDDDDETPARRSSLAEDTPVPPAPPPPRTEDETVDVRPARPPPITAGAGGVITNTPPRIQPAPRAPWSPTPSAADKLAALRQRKTPRGEPAPLDVRASWRDDVVLWTRTLIAGKFDKAAPVAPPIETVAARFDLPPGLVPALVLLYGAHLAGHHGAAPADLARALGRSWDEALGRGRFAADGLAIYERSRVILAAPILRALDELPPITGELVGTPSAINLLGPAVVIAAAGESLTAIAARLVVTLGGAILVAHAHDGPSKAIADLVLEARVRSAIPMRWASEAPHLDTALILVVRDAAHAGRLELPIVG